MSRRIRIDVRACRAKGGEIYTTKPSVPIAIGAGLAVLIGVCLIVSRGLGVVWYVQPVVGLLLGPPLLAVSELALYRFLVRETVGGRDLLSNLSPRKWLLCTLAVLWIGAVAFALVYVVTLPYFYVSGVTISLAYVLFGISYASDRFGLALSAAVLAGPALAVAFGWLFAPLHILRDDLGLVAALRRSWNTTFGSKRLILRMAIVTWVLIALYAIGAYSPRGRLLGFFSIPVLLLLGFSNGPRLLSSALAAYVSLEQQRAEEVEEARSWFKKSA